MPLWYHAPQPPVTPVSAGLSSGAWLALSLIAYGVLWILTSHRGLGFIRTRLWSRVKFLKAWRPITLIAGAVIVWFVGARSSAGWPGALGFPGDATSWATFWITFWAGAAPTIATAAVITVGAGIYLSNRDHKIAEQAEKRITEQSCRSNMVLLEQNLARATVHSRVAALGLMTTAAQMVSPRTLAVRDVLRQSPWRSWQSVLPDLTDLFTAMNDVDTAYHEWERLATAFDPVLRTAIRTDARDLQAGRIQPVPDGVTLTVPEQTQHAYGVGRAQAQPPEHLAMLLNLPDVTALEAFWVFVQQRNPNLPGQSQALNAATLALEARIDTLARTLSRH